MFHHSLLHVSQKGHVRGQLYMSLTSPAFIALRVLMRFDHIMRSCAVSFLCSSLFGPMSSDRRFVRESC